MITTTTETVTCRFCRKQFEAERVDGQLQCTDGAGLVCCDECYDDKSGYGRERD